GALKAIAEALVDNKEEIFAANKKDRENGAGLPAPILGRLTFDDHKLADCVKGINDLIAMPDPLFRKQMVRELDEGLTLVRSSCPIGVIGVIFESRPDALVQISALCIKSGNCVILKGGSEAKESNRKLFDVIYKAGTEAGLPEGFAMLVESREGIGELLSCHDAIDLIIPRGSNEFVQYIMANTKIPVMGHADGICTIYVDKDADMAKAAKIIADAKEQYVSACNAAEVVLVHKDIDKDALVAAVKAEAEHEIDVHHDGEYKEYLNYELTMRTVDSVDEAIMLINRNGSHHTDSIITENKETAQHFMDFVDSAGVYHNCSTRFADGYRYGFGAEVGISTGKIHARGPVGLEGLLTYKYKLYGNGHIVGDYATGKKSFHFKDMDADK
ncbi:MAG: glutamate-5-semialdehyde dehydrogenase, partial [Mogibacterium sp.]|nr:glutamate-5-semialdehyde dehydrogenase [Mogibacterium sp.]